MSNIQESETILRSGNIELASKLKSLVHDTVDKSIEMVRDATNQNDLYTAIKIAEVAGKMTGIVAEKQIANIQINAVSGFTFIEVDKESIIQETRKQIESNKIIDAE